MMRPSPPASTLPVLTAAPQALGPVRLATHSCARCGAQTSHDPSSARATHSATTPATGWVWLMLFLLGPLPALLIHILTRQTRKVECTLCARCARMHQRRRGVYMAHLFSLGLICVPALGFGSEAGIVLLLLMLFTLPLTAYWSKFKIKLRLTPHPGHMLLLGVHPRAFDHSPNVLLSAHASAPDVPKGPPGADGSL